MINLYDNFLSKEDFSYVKENILDNRYFPWYHNDYKVTPEDNIVQFTHMFYEKHNKNSDHYKFLEPILNIINPSAIRRIKANITYREKDFKKFELHTDFNGNFENQKTGIFFRLPTEAEWTLACQGQKEEVDSNAWHYENSNEKYHKAFRTMFDLFCYIIIYFFISE